MATQEDIAKIEGEGTCRTVEVERMGGCFILWQDNHQPSNDGVWLSKRMARELRDELNKLEL